MGRILKHVIANNFSKI